jgi:hypothetical protein
MRREVKRRQTLGVRHMFEPDRMSSIHLQIAYEQLLPPRQYRIVPPEPIQIKILEKWPSREEVPA